jgi:hypothetical protein
MVTPPLRRRALERFGIFVNCGALRTDLLADSGKFGLGFVIAI